MTNVPLNPPPPGAAPKKTPVVLIIGIVLAVTCCPVGVLGAIAVPNFLRFNLRSRQAECKSELKSAFVAQKAYFAERDTYDEDASKIGFAPVAGRYLYALGPMSTIPPKMSGAPPPAVLLAGLPGSVRADLGLRGTCPTSCEVLMACAADLDNDATIDVWTISTADRTIGGQLIPAGQPFNDVSDVTD
jgi:type IV pilus assembly protein PilA